MIPLTDQLFNRQRNLCSHYGRWAQEPQESPVVLLKLKYE